MFCLTDKFCDWALYAAKWSFLIFLRVSLAWPQLSEIIFSRGFLSRYSDRSLVRGQSFFYENFSFRDHISQFQMKISRNLRILRKLKHIFQTYPVDISSLNSNFVLLICMSWHFAPGWVSADWNFSFLVCFCLLFLSPCIPGHRALGGGGIFDVWCFVFCFFVV